MQMHDGDVFPGASACQPYLYEGFERNESKPEAAAILPCGQISHSNFNDSFVLLSDSSIDLSIDVRLHGSVLTSYSWAEC